MKRDTTVNRSRDPFYPAHLLRHLFLSNRGGVGPSPARDAQAEFLAE
jgi:hypothetical protein